MASEEEEWTTATAGDDGLAAAALELVEVGAEMDDVMTAVGTCTEVEEMWD